MLCWLVDAGQIRQSCVLHYWLVFFRPLFCTCNSILGREQPGLTGWILLWIMTLVQDRSLDLLTSSPAHYHCTTDATSCVMQMNGVYKQNWNTKIKQVCQTNSAPMDSKNVCSYTFTGHAIINNDGPCVWIQFSARLTRGFPGKNSHFGVKPSNYLV